MSLLDPKAQASLDTFIFNQLLKSAGLGKGMSGMAGMVFTDVLAEAVAKGTTLVPLPPQAEAQVTSGFGPRVDPFTGERAFHSGVDVEGREGEPITAAFGGTVVSAQQRGGYGNVVELDHGNGVHTLYAHASKLLVEPGAQVEAGQVIAEVGSTGRSTGPHLHLELRVDGKPADPSSALKAYRARAEDPGRGGLP